MTRRFDQSFAPIPKSDERYARQYRFVPPPYYLWLLPLRHSSSFFDSRHACMLTLEPFSKDQGQSVVHPLGDPANELPCTVRVYSPADTHTFQTPWSQFQDGGNGGPTSRCLERTGAEARHDGARYVSRSRGRRSRKLNRGLAALLIRVGPHPEPILISNPTSFFVPDIHWDLGDLEDPSGSQILISFPLLPSLGSLGTTMGTPTRPSSRHHMPLPGNECAFRGPPTTLGCTPQAPVPRPRGRSNSWTINPRFFQFSGHFSISRGPMSFFVPDLHEVPAPRSFKIPEAPKTLISFPPLPSLGSLGTTLGKPTRASGRHHIPLPGHECAFREPPTFMGAPHENRCPGPQGGGVVFVDYDPHFFQFSGHFPTSRGSTSFFVPDIHMVPKEPQIVISFPLLPSLGSPLPTTMGRPTRPSSWHQMPLPGHKCAFSRPPTTLGCTPWAPMPRPRGRLNSQTITHDFSYLWGIFRFLGAQQFFFVLDLHRVPEVLKNPQGASYFHFLNSHLCLSSARLARSLVGLRRPPVGTTCLLISGHKCASRGSPTFMGFTLWAPVPGPRGDVFVDYDPRFFKFSGHFLTSQDGRFFFRPGHPQGPRGP